jgi:hypothetical protein
MSIKKLIATVGIVSLAFLATPAVAQPTQKSIAIIDANFESSLISGDVVDVCVMGDVLCNVVTKPKNASQYEAYNHGTIMADIVRANNPTAKIILIRASTNTVGLVNGHGLDAALNWIVSNRSAHNIVSVSFSYNSGDGKTCLPSTPGKDARVAHAEIVSDVRLLLQDGTKFFAAAGNNGASKNYLDYPACIGETVSVGSTLYPTTRKLADVFVSGSTYTSNRLTSANKTSSNAGVIGLGLPERVRVGNTTSVATAIIAATN